MKPGITILCTRMEEIAIPEGNYAVCQCGECGHDVYVAANMARLAETVEADIACSHCISAPVTAAVRPASQIRVLH